IFADVGIDHLFAVVDYGDFVAFAGDLVAVPFAGAFEHRFAGRHKVIKRAAVLVRLQLALILRTVVVEGLNFEAGGARRLLGIRFRHTQENATIAILDNLPLHAEDIIRIHFFGTQPPGAGFGGQDAVLYAPVAALVGRNLALLPTLQIFAVEKGNK